ncbi:MAG TPA: potassium channel family protein [Solirubrobacteraceae bacterium]|nr:potassium channel family protein [Solirubrobacteraceae bacterium]
MTATGGHHRRIAAAVDARTQATRASHAYRGVLALIILAFVFSASAPNESWTRGVLLLIQSATLATALWRSREKEVRGPLLVILAAVILAAAQIIYGGDALTSAAATLSGLFVIVTIVVIGRGVIRKGVVDQESVIGAIGIYLLLGMLFTFAYAVLATEGAGPFFAQGTDGTAATRLYFSYTTLCTVGYGDYTAASNLGHTLAVSEALLGQLYLVTVVALLVGRVRPRGDGSPPPAS